MIEERDNGNIIEHTFFKPTKEQEKKLGKCSDRFIDMVEEQGLSKVETAFLLQCRIETFEQTTGGMISELIPDKEKRNGIK